ncbi:hypothetical protein JB92DRAFT_2779484, partial [Gautieria morchelliformis]
QTGPTNFFWFIINPSDFGKTVENLYYVSFLIREGKCAFEFTEDRQEPIICMNLCLCEEKHSTFITASFADSCAHIMDK